MDIYARVSTKDKGQEVENQLRQLREFAVTQGWTIFREYVDHETGKNDDRAEFQTMFRDASQRKFDVLLFWSLDRLSREGVLETLQHLNRLTSQGVGYRSFTEQYFDSCGIFKDAVIAIVATVAKQERIRISERVKAGLETARAKGKRLGRPRVILDARRIAMLRKQGRSWPQIAKQLCCVALAPHTGPTRSFPETPSWKAFRESLFRLARPRTDSQAVARISGKRVQRSVFGRLEFSALQPILQFGGSWIA